MPITKVRQLPKSFYKVVLAKDAKAKIPLVDIMLALSQHREHEQPRSIALQTCRSQLIQLGGDDFMSIHHSREGLQFFIVTKIDRIANESVTVIMLPEKVAV